MELSNHPGLSEADVEAAEVLDELRKTITNTRNQLTNIVAVQQKTFNPTIAKSPDNEGTDSKPITREGSTNLLNRVVDSVVTFYDDRRKVASIARLLDDAYEDNYTTSEDETDSDMSDVESDGNEDIERHTLTKKSQPQHQSEIHLVDKHSEKRQHESDESNNEDDDGSDEEDEDNEDESDTRILKRQKISEAIDNFKEYKFNMSIESKKRLITCLHLLKLANKQLSEKVTNLQELVQKENEAEHQHEIKMGLHSHTLKKNPHNRTVSISSLISHDDEMEPTKQQQEHAEEEEEEEEFFDAFDTKENDEQATIIKMEVVGTIKKVYSMISRFTGSSLPEPARSQVRASLLNLPINWSSTVSHLSSNDKNAIIHSTKPDVNISNNREEEPYISTNGKVLILAKESLDMVHNVMEVVDSTLGKAEEWMKQKQEIKEVLYEKFRQTKLNKEK